MRYLVKSSEEVGSPFSELIGKDVTWKHDMYSIEANLLYKEGEKAFISDVQYRVGFWGGNSQREWREPCINGLYINGISAATYSPNSFLEFAKDKDTYIFNQKPPMETKPVYTMNNLTEELKAEAHKIRMEIWGDEIGEGIKNDCREEGIIEGAQSDIAKKIHTQGIEVVYDKNGLLPCPFCAGVGVEKTTYRTDHMGYDREYYFVECENCYARGESDSVVSPLNNNSKSEKKKYSNTVTLLRNKAINDWNKRQNINSIRTPQGYISIEEHEKQMKDFEAWVVKTYLTLHQDERWDLLKNFKSTTSNNK